MSFTETVESTIEAVDAGQWNACARRLPHLQHAFLLALERSGAAAPQRGVMPLYLLIRDAAGELVACAPAMLKVGTLAEYGPEHRWLEAGLASGCFSWPKLQAGVPLYPIRGPKLLVRPGLPEAALRARLLEALKRLAACTGVEALNVMHVDAAEADDLARAGWIVSRETHGFLRVAGHATYGDYLSTLPYRKRRQARRDRARADALGLDVRFLHGEEVTAALLERYYEGHVAVCSRHGNRPWLPQSMFAELLGRLPAAVRLIAAFDGDRYVAGMFCLIDDTTLYLRTWSAVATAPGLAVDLICHRPIEFAISQRLCRIDSGLTAPHKQLRGYREEPVFCGHWFLDPRLAALAEQTLREGERSAAREKVPREAEQALVARRTSHPWH
jgi:predicted N-acyltransferase